MVEAESIGTIAILRECKNKWERRCSLTPKEVAVVVKAGIKVIVQPSSIRCFSDDQFSDVGAHIQEDVSEASVIFGVKEVPVANLMANKTYFFFSHTIKAQDYNMGLLDKMKELNIRMVDFECIREPKVEGKFPQRLVAFGRYAGIAGAFDFLRGIGEFLLQKQYQTPFLIGSSYMYLDYESMQYALAQLAKNIREGGMPRALAPMVFGVTGTGRVAQGSIEVLEQLPHVKVPPSELREYLANPENANNNRQIIISTFASQDIARPKDSSQDFNKEHYYRHPEQYNGCFKEYLDLVTWLVNGIYWEAKYPRVLSKKDLRDAIEADKCKLMGVTDISADYEGSVEFTSIFTSIEEPFLLYNPIDETFKDKIDDKLVAKDILYTSVDHLPAEMPKEASNHFGSKLIPFVEAVVRSDFGKPFAEQTDLPEEIRNAVITAHGELTPDYAYIQSLREANEAVARQEDNESTNCQGFTICLSGHLFDTQCFNSCLNACESNGVNFRVIEWAIGNRVDQNTEVSIQCLSLNEQALDTAREKVNEICAAHKVTITEASGPAFDKKVLRKLNADHTN